MSSKSHRLATTYLDKIRTRRSSKKAKNVAIAELDLQDTKPVSFRNVNEAINAESALGRTIFGPIPVGHQREFFKYKDNIWIWYENWHEKGKKKSITVRYEVRKDGVYKKTSTNKVYNKIDGDELANFKNALRAYLRLVKENLY